MYIADTRVVPGTVLDPPTHDDTSGTYVQTTHTE